jgi:hypothetical protein
MDVVSPAVKEYLKQRKDTCKLIVAKLIDQSEEVLF